MSFTRLRIPQIPPTENDATDAAIRAIVDHFKSLEGKGALAINSITKWTPVLTFVTAGDLSVTYSGQTGRIVRLDDKLVAAYFRIATSAFTHTTAAGDLQITGLPTGYSSATESGFLWIGNVLWSGITKAGYTQICPRITSASNKITFGASGSGVAVDSITATDTPTGGTMVLVGCVVYEVE